MEGKDILLPLLLMEQTCQTAAQTQMLVNQGMLLTAQICPTSSEPHEPTDACAPGRGNAVLGSKARYAMRQSTYVYQDIRENDPDILLFEKTTHMSREDFDNLHNIARNRIEMPIDVRSAFGEQHRVPRSRRLDSEEMLFLFLDMLGGPNEGGIGIERTAHRYGISPGTVSNYFRHVLYALFHCLDACQPKLIQWPDTNEREEMEDLIIGFPQCVFFIDGNKSKRWRPKENSEQERAYDGYKKAHAWSVLAFCDLFGRFIRLEISDKGAESDRNMYTSSEVFRDPTSFLSPGQHGMADMGFAGSGALVVPYKRNESTTWMYRSVYNKRIRKQRMVNEWGIGYLNNRFRLFLGRWPFEKALFPIAYHTAALLCNWQMKQRGYPLQPRSRYESKLAALAAQENEDDDLESVTDT